MLSKSSTAVAHTKSYKVIQGIHIHMVSHTQTVGHMTPKDICKHPQITNEDTQASLQLHARSYRHTLQRAPEAQPGQDGGQEGSKASGDWHPFGGKGKELGKPFICSRKETHPTHPGNLALDPE